MKWELFLRLDVDVVVLERGVFANERHRHKGSNIPTVKMQQMSLSMVSQNNSWQAQRTKDLCWMSK